MTSVSRANSSSVLQSALGLLVLAFSLVVLIGGAVAQTADRLSRDIEYQLDAGDRVRVIVFNEPDLSGEFEVDGTGVVSLPLIGKVSARGLTARDFEDAIATALLDGYLKDPRVSIEVLNFRPFYIIGEVENGGEYDYVPDMTVLNAVALAGGRGSQAEPIRVRVRRDRRGRRRRPVLDLPTPRTPR